MDAAPDPDWASRRSDTVAATPAMTTPPLRLVNIIAITRVAKEGPGMTFARHALSGG